MSALGHKRPLRSAIVMSALPQERAFALIFGCSLKAKSGNRLASLEPDPNPLPLTKFDSSPLHPALWYGRKHAKINLAVGGSR